MKELNTKLYQSIKFNVAESQELIRLQNVWLSKYQTLLAEQSPTANIYVVAVHSYIEYT